jgi:hypothetical protein
MRVSKVFLGIALVAGLCGCTAGIPAPPSAEAPAGAGESATRSAISNAKIALVAFFVSNPDQDTVTVDQLAEYGYGMGGVPVRLHVSAPDDFCVDAVAASGAKFKATLSSSVEGGVCVEGEDY